MDFRGGFIGYSGTTGYYMNQHGFDDLQILQECLVPLKLLPSNVQLVSADAAARLALEAFHAGARAD
ncbi:MAG: hypothetical protein ISR64_11680 [Deltaproteobacteria bacterium]|nr:hypothetical protein [Deltaproteobacteria bacterium]